jgi:hypothetical protein
MRRINAALNEDASTVMPSDWKRPHYIAQAQNRKRPELFRTPEV